MSASVLRFGGHGAAIVPLLNLLIKNETFPHPDFSIPLMICKTYYL